MNIENIKRNIINIPGWHTNRKIVVIESDDWGSIRMRSKQDYNWFLKNGYRVDECPYNANDSLESNDDLGGLLETLSSVKDKNGNFAKFTMNNVVANPDYTRIREARFSEYFFEPFTETLESYPKHDKVMSLYREGIKDNLIKPQFHGREHLNIQTWLDALQNNVVTANDAFDREMFTVHREGALSGRKEYLDVFGLDNKWGKQYYQEIVRSGIELFENIWGFKSRSWIAPTYVWPTFLEETLSEEGVKYHQGTYVQRIPPSTVEGKQTRKYHYLGHYNGHKQIYLVRNAFFEPTSNFNANWIDSCMNEIKNAFFWKKPAIISSHRVNFMGGLNPKNRSKNLRLLQSLLKKVVTRYPDVEFMFSDELGELIEGKNNVRN